MENITELTEYIADKAKQYLEETGEVIEKYPLSIVDFVIEYAISQCHFPKNFTEKQILADLERNKNSLAMACNDVYGKIGSEGQVSHGELGINRTYDSSWITPKLLSGLPNYVTVL